MVKLNYNGLEIPDFLNESFFEESLKKGLSLDFIKINEISFSIGNTNGNGYTSNIFRAVVNYNILNELTNQKIYLIIKVVNDKGDLLTNLKVFDREKKLYMEILPKLTNLFNNEVKFGPKCFSVTDKPQKIFVFEDLKYLGYKLEDRITGFDEQHAKAVLNKIATFHAGSMVLFKNEPQLNDFNSTCFHIDFDENIKNEIFLENIKYLQKYLKQWKNYDSIIKKLEKIEKNFYQKVLEVVNRRNIGLCALTHGDLWVDNIMFKKDKENKILDVIFIDYQVCYYGSLCLDLQNILNNSIAIDVLKSKRYEFLHYYYSALQNILQIQNYSEIPKWENFKNEIKLTEFYGFMSMEAFLPLTILDRNNQNESPSLEIFNNKDITNMNRVNSFKSIRMIETLKYSLNRFDELGVFD